MASGTLTKPAAAAPGGWQRFRRNLAALSALWFLFFVLVGSFLFPFLLDPARSEPSPHNFKPPGHRGELTVVRHENGQAVEKNLTFTYLWGADVNGRDLLRRTIEGGRVSLMVGLCAAALSLTIGTLVGMTAGFLGGRVDHIIMRGVDVLYAIPRLLFVLVILGALQRPFQQWMGSIHVWSDQRDLAWLKSWIGSAVPYSRTILMILCLGLIEWLTMARIVRGQVLVLKEQQFIAAARALGRSNWAIMRRHLLPNLWTIILTYLTLTVPVVIMDESFLSFLGLGVEEPATSWGALLKEGAQAVNPIESRWWLLIFPASVMSLTLLALNFVGDGLRDAFDVR